MREGLLRREGMLVFIALRTASLTDDSLRSSDKAGLDTYPEAVMLVATMTGIANGLLAGTFTQHEALDSLQYAISLALPTG